jgi:hypothetical protein
VVHDRDGGGGGGREARPAERPPAPASSPAPKITFKDARREPESTPPSRLPLDVVDLSALLASGVSSAVRNDLTVPPPIPTETEDRATAIVEELLRCSPGAEQGQIPRLLALGPDAAPVVARAFPGALWIDRATLQGRPVSGRAVSAVACALIELGEASVPWVSGLLEADHPDIRFYATLVAAELGHDDLVLALGRLVFDEVDYVRSAALHALGRMGDQDRFATLRATLSSTAANVATHPSYRLHAVAGLDELRDTGSLRLFSELLEDDDASIAESARAALVRLTGRDLGPHPKKWRSWIKKNEDDPREVWLIEGIVDDDESVRRVVAEELRRITDVDLELDPTAPRGDRKRQRKAWRRWWKESGARA